MMARDEGWQRAAERRKRVSGLISAVPQGGGAEGGVDSLQRMCVALTDDLSIMGAAVNLMSAAGSEGVAAGSDERSRRIDELQFTLGEGPCHDAHTSRRPVLTANLQDAAARWPGYSLAAQDAGVAAVFAFPLHVGGTGFGVLDAYADQPGSLSDDDLTTALTFAEIATETLVDGEFTTPGGGLDPALGTALDYRSEIYQAQGMVMVALEVNLAEALARMRAHAFADDRELADVARDIVAGRVALEMDEP